MACDNITDIILRETNRVSGDLYNRIFPRSPWVRLVKRGVFPDGMGHTISVVTYERSAPTDATPTWNLLPGTSESGSGLTSTFNTTAGGECAPTANAITVGSTIRTYNLCRRVLEGPDFCTEWIRFSFQLRDQLTAIMNALTEHVMIEWESRDRHEYLRLVKYKVSCTGTSGAGTTVEATSSNCTLDSTDYGNFWTSVPTNQLQQGHLNYWKIRLLRDGAAGSALGMVDGSPVLTLITSAETSEDIIFKNTETRTDLREGNPSELLRGIGVERQHRGFFHVIDHFPIRGEWIGGQFSELAPFVSGSGSKGSKVDVNSVWEGAHLEVSMIFDPMVFEQLIPQPITAPAPNYKFDAVNYMGDWKVKNIIDRDCNPDGTIMYHRGIMAAASKPVHPERGVAFLHLRCPITVTNTTPFNCS